VAACNHWPEDKSKRRAQADFIDRTAVGKGMANGDVEREVVTSLPDQTEQARYCARLICLVFIEDFGDRAHGPLGRAFDDHPSKNVAVMLAGQRRGDIEVNRAPIPSLRDDTCQARADTAVAIDLRQQDAEFVAMLGPV